LEAVPDLQTIQTLSSGDDLYLFISSQVQQQFKPIGLPADYPLVNGLLYAFGRETGDLLWPGPALLRNRGIVLQQPDGIPLLVFVDRQMTRDAANGGGSQLRVLCTDKRTGQTVYRNEALLDTSVTRFRIRGEASTNPAVAIELGSGRIQLTMTDRPRPPQPPTNDDLEAPRESVERGLKRLGQRFGDALRGAFEGPAARPTPQQLQPQPQNKPPVQNGVPAGEQNPPDTDDD
jgi:hypothetical protein